MWETLTSNFLQFAILGLLGLIISLYPDFTEKYKKYIVICFVTASILILILSTFMAYKQDRQDKSRWDILTGGNSYPVVIPQIQTTEGYPLIIWNKGESPLSGVTVTIRKDNDFSLLPKPAYEIGTLPPFKKFGERQLPVFIAPSVDDNSSTISGEKTDGYIIQMTSQSGLFNEIIQFQKACSSFKYRYWVIQPGWIGETGKILESSNGWLHQASCKENK